MDEPIKPHRPLPWAVAAGAFTAAADLPVDDTADGKHEPCRSRSPHHFLCTMPIGHDGFHRAGDGTSILAEWVRDDPKPPAALVAEFPAELGR